MNSPREKKAAPGGEGRERRRRWIEVIYEKGGVRREVFDPSTHRRAARKKRDEVILTLNYRPERFGTGEAERCRLAAYLKRLARWLA